MTIRAVWRGQVLAESEKTLRLEGNHYFPVESLNREFFVESATTSVCPWKGRARYFDVVVDGQVNRDAAWYYPEPSRAAAQIKGRVAFWHGVRVERAEDAPGAERPGMMARLRGLLGDGR
ncbi:DUF427 domain-containing protein [Actinocorallia sp. B10E7]|uniref:DUF427 domain-containing protein n=1 Tax=Actinocorallia sp. B10E7 TaxID=3153558 RepID=UPI00325C7FF9